MTCKHTNNILFTKKLHHICSLNISDYSYYYYYTALPFAYLMHSGAPYNINHREIEK